MKIDTGHDKTEIKPDMSVIEEKWMFIIRRYPNGQSFPVKFFKLGSDYAKTSPKPKKSSPLQLSDKEIESEDLL